MVRKVAGIDDRAARRPLVDSGTSLLWLVRHLAHAETRWILHRFAGQPVDLPDDRVQPDDTLAAAVDSYRETWARADAVIDSSSLEEPCRNPDDSAQVNLRWVLMHLLEETARHAGHADILREMIDGHTGR